MTLKTEDVRRIVLEAGSAGVTRKEIAVLLGVPRHDAGLHMALEELARRKEIDHDRTAPLSGPLRWRATQ